MDEYRGEVHPLCKKCISYMDKIPIFTTRKFFDDNKCTEFYTMENYKCTIEIAKILCNIFIEHEEKLKMCKDHQDMKEKQIG